MTVDILEAKREMYQSLRRGLNDEFGSGAKITKIDALVRANGSIQDLSFIVCVDDYGRILRGEGDTHSEIMSALHRNKKECYNDRIKRELYYLNEPAPETDGAGGVQGNVEQINVY